MGSVADFSETAAAGERTVGRAFGSVPLRSHYEGKRCFQRHEPLGRGASSGFATGIVRVGMMPKSRGVGQVWLSRGARIISVPLSIQREGPDVPQGGLT
jgi:hypothetical protein